MRRRTLLKLPLALATANLIGMKARAENSGGHVVIARDSQPALMDPHATSNEAARFVNLHWSEALFTRDDNAQPIPELAQSFQVSDDGKVYTFTLREGVKFHNGLEMTAEDVKASLERYKRLGANQSALAAMNAASVIARYKISVHLDRPVPSFIDQISSPRAPISILPADECNLAAGKLNCIGTGPFRFVEYRPDSHVRLERFGDYSANRNYEQRNGLGGRKTVYLDSIEFRYIAEPGARAAALEAGDVQIVDPMPASAARRLRQSGSIDILELMPWGMQTFLFNLANPPLDNIVVRQAIRAAIDPEAIMAISGEGLYRLGHAWMYPESVYSPGDTGREHYKINDLEKARDLLVRSGYRGEEVVMLAESNGPQADAAIVLQQMLNAIGLNMRIAQVDIPTLFKMRAQTSGWHISSNGLGIEPYEGPFNLVAKYASENGGQGAQWAADQQLQAISEKLNSAPDLAGRRAAVMDFQRRMDEFIPAIRVGDYGRYQGVSKRLEGYQPSRIPRMWNVWYR